MNPSVTVIARAAGRSEAQAQAQREAQTRMQFSSVQCLGMRWYDAVLRHDSTIFY